jgi:hypothetical protein
LINTGVLKEVIAEEKKAKLEEEKNQKRKDEELQKYKNFTLAIQRAVEEMKDKINEREVFYEVSIYNNK